MRKYFLLSLLFLIILKYLSAGGNYDLNRNYDHIPNLDDDAPVLDVLSIYRVYSENPVNADLLYDEKRLRVRGYIIDFEYGIGMYFVRIANRRNGDESISIRFRPSEASKLADLEKGQEIIIDGVWDSNQYGLRLADGALYRVLSQSALSRTILEEGITYDYRVLSRQSFDNTIWTFCMYNGKRLRISGVIGKIERNEKIIITFSLPNRFAWHDEILVVEIAETQINRVAELRVGQTIEVEGIGGYVGAYKYIRLLDAVILN